MIKSPIPPMTTVAVPAICTATHRKNGLRKMPWLLFLLLLFPRFNFGRSLDEAIRFYEKGEYRQAIHLLQQWKSSSPEEPDIRLWLGKSFLKNREWDNAVKEIEKAVQLQPSNARYHLWLGRASGARASNTVFFKAIGWARRVVKEFETARKIAPEDLDVRFDLLDFYLNAPGIMGGGKEKAEAEAQAISRLDPRKRFIAQAAILQKDSRWDQARKALTQATLEYPDQADAWKDLADFLLERKDYAAAYDHAKRALALDSKSKRTRLIAAACQTRLHQDLDQAARTLEELSLGPLGDEDPAFEEVYYWLGEYHLANGDKAKAREAFKSALVYNPDYARAKNAVSSIK